MTILKMLKIRITVIGFIMVVALFFSGCKYDTNQKNKVVTITLLNLRDPPKDKSIIYNDSIQIKYTQIDENTQRVRRVFFFNNRKPIVVNYFLIKSGDSITYIKPSNDSTRSVYINLKSTRASNLFFDIPQQYLEASLRYIKVEKCLDKKKQIDKLLILYGNDVGFIGSTDSLYYYFDKTIHLRKIVSRSGERLYSDKNIY